MSIYSDSKRTAHKIQPLCLIWHHSSRAPAPPHSGASCSYSPTPVQCTVLYLSSAVTTVTVNVRTFRKRSNAARRIELLAMSEWIAHSGIEQWRDIAGGPVTASGVHCSHAGRTIGERVRSSGRHTQSVLFLHYCRARLVLLFSLLSTRLRTPVPWKKGTQARETLTSVPLGNLSSGPLEASLTRVRSSLTHSFTHSFIHSHSYMALLMADGEWANAGGCESGVRVATRATAPNAPPHSTQQYCTVARVGFRLRVGPTT